MGRRLLFSPTDEYKAAIKSLYLEGCSCQMLARQYKVSESQMGRCIRLLGVVRCRRESTRLAVEQGRVGSHRADTRFNGWGV